MREDSVSTGAARRDEWVEKGLKSKQNLSAWRSPSPGIYF